MYSIFMSYISILNCSKVFIVLYVDILHIPLSDLTPNGVWEVGSVLEDDEIHQGYSERFLLKFLAYCQVECT